jgi:pyruvate dehydrogenase E2 component (dihydrolipoyllysine-residue acetyltransferase)
VAVDSPQGLLVPVVRDVDKKTITEIAKDIMELAEKAHDGKVTAEQMRGGSFTITNVGVIGGLAFTPIINWPEAAILGLGRMHDQPAIANGQLVNRKVMPLMLTFDHRLIDGAEGARFVNDIKQYLENPLLLLLEM